mgnify:CR=1 FL=1
MVQQSRQPGSTIKPLVYSYGFMNLPLTIDTPIFDIPFTIGNDRPNDNDDSFEGMLPLRKALGHSRNIPAIKMYFAVGGQDKLIPYFNSIGINSYDAKKDYGYPLSIGAGELKMMELAAYRPQLRYTMTHHFLIDYSREYASIYQNFSWLRMIFLTRENNLYNSVTYLSVYSLYG